MTSKPTMDLTRLVETPDMIVTRGSMPDMSGVPVVVFASAAEETRQAITLEFVQQLAMIGRPAIWIADPNETWYATEGFVDRACAIIETEMARLGATQIDTIGASMGAFGALAFAERLPVRTAIALGTRFTPDRRIVPDPRRKKLLRPYLSKFPFRTIEAGMAAAEHAVVVHGDRGFDQPHVLRIEPPETTEHWVVPECGHLVGKKLRERNAFQPFVRSALAQDWDRMREALRSADARPAIEARPVVEKYYTARLAREAKENSRYNTLVKPVLRRIKTALLTTTQPFQRQK
ncbi:hypothetical protein [Flavimaricola marinus]|uniref:Alpha/beta hydrolase family protein n=1 Tax=Flavimaricola marinus TaxID=1819565 RepID=A0A238LID1_9RHOB|nr:hypothetical protein [Flavimaricola marinus]SMY09372.1 hypothetical protein LOM8899_03538 [Flavimaricola marinus]